MVLTSIPIVMLPFLTSTVTLLLLLTSITFYLLILLYSVVNHKITGSEELLGGDSIHCKKCPGGHYSLLHWLTASKYSAVLTVVSL